jgi:hypothetical protein
VEYFMDSEFVAGMVEVNLLWRKTKYRPRKDGWQDLQQIRFFYCQLCKYETKDKNTLGFHLVNNNCPARDTRIEGQLKMFPVLPRSIAQKTINNVFRSLGLTIPDACSSVPRRSRGISSSGIQREGSMRTVTTTTMMKTTSTEMAGTTPATQTMTTKTRRPRMMRTRLRKTKRVL